MVKWWLIWKELINYQLTFSIDAKSKQKSNNNDVPQVLNVKLDTRMYLQFMYTYRHIEFDFDATVYNELNRATYIVSAFSGVTSIFIREVDCI